MDYIGRSTWGAQHDAGSGERAIPCTEAWLHHTVTKQLSVTASPAEEREQMRAVESIGEQRFGQGFSYNLAVMPSGRVYVGCGVRRVGAHTKGRNTKALGIVLVGDYDKHAVPQQMFDALVELLRDAKRLGWLRAPKLDGGHRDVSSTGTACTGRYAYRLIGEANRRAAAPPPDAKQPPKTETKTEPQLQPQPLVPKGSGMIVVQHPSNAAQYVADATTARHITFLEAQVLAAAKVPYVGENEASDAARTEFLRLRGVTL